MYKPGQIVTVRIEYLTKRFRLIKCDEAQVTCSKCDLHKFGKDPMWFYCTCYKYCARKYNDWDRNPNGYILREISPSVSGQSERK